MSPVNAYVGSSTIPIVGQADFTAVAPPLDATGDFLPPTVSGGTGSSTIVATTLDASFADVPAPIVSGGSGGGSGTVIVSTNAQLTAALVVGNSGKQILLTPGTYAGLNGTSVRMTSLTTVEAQTPGTVSIGGIQLQGARFLTFKNLTITSGSEYDNACEECWLQNCTLGPMTGNIFQTNATNAGAGNGVGGTPTTVPHASGLRNCKLIGETGTEDGFFITAAYDFWIDRCEVTGIQQAGTSHSDVIQIFPYRLIEQLHFVNNYIHDIPIAQGYFAKDFPSVNCFCVNNLFLRGQSGEYHGAQVYSCNTITITDNTCAQNGTDSGFRGGANSNSGITYDRNVGTLAATNNSDIAWSTVAPNVLSSSNNILTSGSSVTAANLNTTGTGNQSVASPVFINSASDDYRLSTTQGYPANCGVDWRPADFVFGVGG